MCGTRQWITYQSYWSRYSDVDRVSAGSHVTNDDSVRWLYLLCLSLTSKALQIVRHMIIGRWTNICLDARWRLRQQIDFAEQKMEEWSYFHVCSRLSLLFLKRDTKLVTSMTIRHFIINRLTFQSQKGQLGKINDNHKTFFFAPHTSENFFSVTSVPASSFVDIMLPYLMQWWRNVVCGWRDSGNKTKRHTTETPSPWRQHFK